MGWIPEEVIEELRGSHELAVFIYMATDPEMRLFYGVNDIPTGIQGVDPTTSEVYLGGGRLLEIPVLEVLINGIADRVEFVLSGLDPASAEEIDSNTPPVRGADFYIAVTTLDKYYQPMTSPIPMAAGRASHTTEKSDPVTGNDPVTVSMGLSVGFGAATRSRNTSVLWSSVHQKMISPDDLFCDHTARQARGVQVTWPRF